MNDLYKVYTVVLSILINSKITVTQDASICNFTTTKSPPPPPRLSKSYSTTIEWKNLYTNSTTVVNEYYNGIDQIGSQDIYIDKKYTKVVYNNKESQYSKYTQAEGCTVSDLGSFTFLNDQVWISAFNVLYGVILTTVPTFIEQTTARNMTVRHWQTCLYILESQITAKIDFYFTVNWNMAQSTAASFSPVRFEILGSVKNKSTGTLMPFHVIGDFINYNPAPDLSDLQTHMQLPPGVFCPAKKSSKPLNPISSEFSILYEIIDYTKQTITYEHIWYNNMKKLIRRDYKQADNTDPDATMEIYDFNRGIHYAMDVSEGTCAQADLLKLGDRYVSPNGNNTIRMISTIEFFHVKNSQIQYVGYRKTRGITCDVWVGRYVDPNTNINTTIEWYFNKGYSEAVGGTISYSSLTRIDIWQGSSKYPVVRNVLQFDSEAPTQDVFSVGLCYKTQRIRLIIHLRVINGSVSTVSERYLKDTLHVKLTRLAFLPALRIADVMVYPVGPNDLYFDGSLLEKAPYTNDHIVPKPPKAHELKTAFHFLRGSLKDFPNIVITNSSKTPLVLQALGIQQLDYSAEFSTTVPTPTTPLRTPPTPEIIPPTIKPETPTTYRTPNVMTPSKNPSSYTMAPCICPVSNCTTPPPVTCLPSQPNTQCNCPNLVCPDSPKPLATCPSPPPCAVITCPPPKPCTPRACPKVTCSPCKPCAQSSVKCHVTSSTITTKMSTTASTTTNSNQNDPSQQTGSDNSQSGVSSGAAAGIAIGLLVVGFIIGIVVLRSVQIFIARRKNDERTNFFSKYLTDESNY